jgi:CubicO group peptidase (beta-lactamase class C family)
MGELQGIAQAGGEAPPGFLYDAACRSYLNFEPGTAYRYNSMTFSVLAELVTRLGGERYPGYLQHNVFEPLGMSDTAFAPGDRSRTAPIYGLGPPPIVEGFIRMEMPGGGLWSTAADLIAFGQAYLRGGTSAGGYRLLSPASIDLMTRNYSQGARQFGTGDRFNYGLGWGKRSWQPDGDLLASEKAFGHGGASGTLLWVDPEYDFVYVFLSNGWDMVDPFDVRARCLNVVYGAISI